MIFSHSCPRARSPVVLTVAFARKRENKEELSCLENYKKLGYRKKKTHTHNQVSRLVRVRACARLREWVRLTWNVLEPVAIFVGAWVAECVAGGPLARQSVCWLPRLRREEWEAERRTSVTLMRFDRRLALGRQAASSPVRRRSQLVPRLPLLLVVLRSNTMVRWLCFYMCLYVASLRLIVWSVLTLGFGLTLRPSSNSQIWVLTEAQPTPIKISMIYLVISGHAVLKVLRHQLCLPALVFLKIERNINKFTIFVMKL